MAGKIFWSVTLCALLTAVKAAQTGILDTRKKIVGEWPAAVKLSPTYAVPPGRWTTVVKRNQPDDPPIEFPLGTATPSEVCGKCHGAIYFENAFGLWG